MMIMEKALWQVIAEIPTLNIGTGTEEDPVRVYYSVADDNSEAPYIIIQRVDSDRWRHVNGPSGTVQATMQIDFYSEEKWETKRLAQLVEGVLDGYAGSVPITGTSPMYVCKFAGISCQNDVDLYDKTANPYLYRVSADYLVTYEQT